MWISTGSSCDKVCRLYPACEEKNAKDDEVSDQCAPVIGPFFRPSPSSRTPGDGRAWERRRMASEGVPERIDD